MQKSSSYLTQKFTVGIIVSCKNVNIKLKTSGLKNYIIKGISNRIEQIIANLLDNAVSFSPANSKITVSCGVKKQDAQLIIEDEGPGFNEKNIDKIFNRFYSNRPEKFGEHSGLGLNIVKNIIELHGGSITASNHLGSKKGARIEVLLPIYL